MEYASPIYIFNITQKYLLCYSIDLEMCIQNQGTK